MRKVAFVLAVAVTLLAATATVAQGASGGAQAPSSGAKVPAKGASTNGGARYSAAPRSVTQKRTARKTRASKGGAKARGKARRRAARKRPTPAPAPAPLPIPTSDHAFPVAGPYSFGGDDGRFGAKRKGHTHQGQDVAAPEGTPVVAPWGGTVEAIKYQAGGAGHYVVLDGDGEDRDYVFMHLRQGSVLVTKGALVVKGQQLAQVGSTGASTGAHLHIEIWIDGGWYTGGRPTDPLPFLQAWLR